MSSLTIDLNEATLRTLRAAARESQLSLEQVVQSALDIFIQSAQTTPLPSSTSERHSQLQMAAASWRSMPEGERQQYGSDYIAVCGGQVIDHDPDRVTLFRRVRRRVGAVPVLITPANAQSPREFRDIRHRLAW